MLSYLLIPSYFEARLSGGDHIHSILYLFQPSLTHKPDTHLNDTEDKRTCSRQSLD